MKSIQIITKNGNEEALRGANITLSKLATPYSFDSFDINIIMLDRDIWISDNSYCSSINSIRDLKNINPIIKKSVDSKIIIILPQNINFYYGSETYIHDKKAIEIKNLLPEIKEILKNLIDDFKTISLHYENTLTKIGVNYYESSFCFDDDDVKTILTKSDKSRKDTTIEKNNIVYSTLKFENSSQIIDFLKEIKFIVDKEERPKWMEEVNMFDDKELKTTINECEDIIRQQNIKIDESNIKLETNSRYESILYTQGQELVDVVFEICNEMFGFDLSGFIDTKKEDFLYENEHFSYIAEIKGINTNVKSHNVSQLDTHFYDYIDNHSDKKDSTIALLIINHQRSKPISEREPVHEEQIRLAIRNGSLIIETITLLKLFEKFKKGQISTDDCLQLIQTKTGLLTEKDFYY